MCRSTSSAQASIATPTGCRGSASSSGSSMADATRVALGGSDQAFALAARMRRDVATMAGRLLHLLQQSPMPPDSPLAQGQAFLSAMFDAHEGEQPQPV